MKTEIVFVDKRGNNKKQLETVVIVENTKLIGFAQAKQVPK